MKFWDLDAIMEDGKDAFFFVLTARALSWAFRRRDP